MKQRTLIYFIMISIVAGNTGCHSVKDADGNMYHTVKIGKQVWMKENLKTTRLNDGTPIQMVTSYDRWAELDSPSYSWYNNEIRKKDELGALYNWRTIQTDKLCPAGWHIPTYAEWTQLNNYLKGPIYAGGKLKATGTTYWRPPNTGADNMTGFTALAGGYRSFNGTFNFIRIGGYWWSGSLNSSGNAYFAYLNYKSADLEIRIADKANGFYVRCIKN